MNKTKVKCSRCHSEKLYKFGLGKQANQEYQCKKYNLQFSSSSISTLKKSKYPMCPKLIKDTFCIILIITINE